MGCLAKVPRTKEGSSGAEAQPLILLLFDRLIAVPTITQEGSRQLVIAQLRPEMANAVPYFAQGRLHLLSLIKTCMNYPGGVEELVSAVRLVEGPSIQGRQLDETVAELLAAYTD